MTNKEAIMRINNLIKIIKSPRSIVSYCPEEMEALDLAIKALEEKPQGELIQSLTELCNRYCENCPIIGVPNNECTDCICLHIRGIMKGGAV